MIVFNGYISGKAEKYYFKKTRILGQRLLLFAAIMISPWVIWWSIKTHNWFVLVGYSLIFLVIPLLAIIPPSKKSKKELTPKKIFIEDGYIICVADRFTESRLIADVKQVNEYDEFYEITFPFGKVSDKFICQKSLLSEGTLEEFERIFEKQGTVFKKTGDGSLSCRSY